MTKEKISKRTAQALETKKKIYEAAESLFKEYGIYNVSVDSIVEKAEVSKGAFYIHFESKNALIATLIADYVNKIDLDYKTYIDALPDSTPASDILVSLAEKIVDVMTDTIGYDYVKLIYEENIAKTINTHSLLSYHREIYPIFNKIISRGIQQGEFKTDIPVDIIVNHCVLSIRGLAYEWCIRYPDFDLKYQVLKHFEMLLNGIKNRK